MITRFTLCAAFILGVICNTSKASINFSGPSSSIASASGSWAFDQFQLSGFRAALSNPSNFGPTGVISTPATSTALSTVDPSVLSTVDVFVSTWWREDQSAAFTADIVDFFLAGGSLLLLQDSPDRDGIGQALGLPTLAIQNNPTTGIAPLFDGPFGEVGVVQQGGAFGILDPLAIANTGGL